MQYLSPDNVDSAVPFYTEYFEYDSISQVCRLFSSKDRECSSLSGPRGELAEQCPTSNSEQFLFIKLNLFGLPSFSAHPCPNLQHLPAHLQCDQAGLVEDETGQTRLMVSGGSHAEWWLWRNGNWEKTANSTRRFDVSKTFVVATYSYAALMS